MRRLMSIAAVTGMSIAAFTANAEAVTLRCTPGSSTISIRIAITNPHSKIVPAGTTVYWGMFTNGTHRFDHFTLPMALSNKAESIYYRYLHFPGEVITCNAHT